MQIVQVQNVTVEELVERIRKASVPAPIDPDPDAKKIPEKVPVINVLNRKEAARLLNISPATFDKLTGIGLIPATVTVGRNRQGKPVTRWAEHHLQAIKPTITNLKYNQDEQSYRDARIRIIRALFL